MKAMTEYLSFATAVVSAVLALGQFPSLWRALPIRPLLTGSRHARRRKRLRLYRRAKTLAARPELGLADLGAAGALMLLGVLFELLLVIAGAVQLQAGSPLDWQDGLSMMLVFVLIGVSFVRILSIPVEIRQAPARAHALRNQLRHRSYRPLRGPGGKSDD